MNDPKPPQPQIQPGIMREALSYREGALGIVVDQQGRFLVVKHESIRTTNQWRFPGGGVEEGETPKEAVLREFAEEFGTPQFEIIKQSSLINQFDWPDGTILEHFQTSGKWWRGQRQHQFLLKYTGNPEDLRPDPAEIREMKWASIDELPELFVFPGQWDRVKPVLKDLLG